MTVYTQKKTISEFFIFLKLSKNKKERKEIDEKNEEVAAGRGEKEEKQLEGGRG